MSSGKLLISLLRSAVWVLGQMANVTAQAGLEEKLGIVGNVASKNVAFKLVGGKVCGSKGT